MKVARAWHAIVRPRSWWVGFGTELFRDHDSKTKAKTPLGGTSDI